MEKHSWWNWKAKAFLTTSKSKLLRYSRTTETFCLGPVPKFLFTILDKHEQFGCYECGWQKSTPQEKICGGLIETLCSRCEMDEWRDVDCWARHDTQTHTQSDIFDLIFSLTWKIRHELYHGFRYLCLSFFFLFFVCLLVVIPWRGYP